MPEQYAPTVGEAEIADIVSYTRFSQDKISQI